ncbi:MAG: UbiA family prenyltransferase [Pseudomonadota bacterium]
MTAKTLGPATPDTATPDIDVVLVADLDGTLCRTDTLQEGLLALVTQNPAALLSLPGDLTRGRAALKEKVLDQGVLDPNALPLNDDVIAALTVARAEGRRTALVSAADQRQVEAVATATGLFDEAHGTQSGENLKGPAKAVFLTNRFGENGFDYMGDAPADVPVWAAARQAITVGAGPGLRRRSEAVNPNTVHISPPKGQISSAFQAMRPHQWSKNTLVFLPMLAAHDVQELTTVILTFLAFCLTASAVYVINDLLDLAADRAHPRKRSRPFAAGDLSALFGICLAGSLLLGAVGLVGLTANSGVLGILSVYFSATLAYSAWLKRKLIIDILLLAGLYTIRIVAGGVAAAVVLSPWLLGFSMFIFLALAAVKRQAELADQLHTERSSIGRAYEVEDLPIIRAIAIGAGQAAILVLALYLTSDTVRALYDTPILLWGIAPLLLYWILRMIMKTHRGLMNDDPIVYAATDRVSLLIVIACACFVIAAA